MSNYTNFPNGVSSMGYPVTGIPMILGASGVGTIWYVDATNGSDGNTGTSPDSALATFAQAYSNASSGDTIALSSNSTHSLSAGIAWTKSRINVVGLDFPGRLIQQGAKVQLATAATTAYVIKVTGTRNSFTNIKFINASTQGTSLTVAQFGGEGNLYQNCSFVFGVADNLGGATTYEVVCGEDSGTFINCMFGNDTLLTSAARAVMLLDGVTSGQEMKSCVFKDCIWQISSSSSSADFIRVADTSAVKFTQTFINPVFNNCICSSAGAAALDDTVRSVSGLVEGNLFFVYPASNATEFCTDVTDQVSTYGPATSAQAGEAGTPS